MTVMKLANAGSGDVAYELVVKNMRINHTRVAQVAQEIKTLIYPGSQDSLLLVMGPSGVGKTRLAQFLVEEEIDSSKAQLASDAGVIPAIYVEAESSGEKEFSWRLFYERILDQLRQDISIDSCAYGINPVTGRMERPSVGVRNTLASLRTAVERALRARKTKFLVIDEAAHILNRCSASQMLTQLDTLKSLANRCGSQIVLVGAYDLHKLVTLSAQLARRTHVIHFERYRKDNSHDFVCFKSCLRAYEKKLPDLWDGKLLPYADDLYENSLGCIGSLSSILTKSVRFSYAEGAWGPAALKKAMYSHLQVDQMLQEIVDGEAQIDPSLNREKRKVA